MARYIVIIRGKSEGVEVSASSPKAAWAEARRKGLDPVGVRLASQPERGLAWASLSETTAGGPTEVL